MHEDQSWREYLGTIITNAKEKQRIAEELGIQPITLNRWISGESEPRAHNLRHLLTILPQHRDQLVELIKKEKGFEEFSNTAHEDTQYQIPSEFYSKIFVTLASSTHNLRFWSISSLILQQTLSQLDPERLGMAVWIVRCMPPSGPDRKVRSLRETIGLGTPPWSGHLEQKAMFLGAESLAGNVVTLCRPSVIENLDEEHNLMPISRVENEKSAAIYPILYTGRIAGVLMISSTQYNYFLSQSRATLLQNYADLIALAFELEDFYASEDISLCVMPSHEEQKPLFANFRQRVADIMIDAANRNERLNNVQADLLVWRQLEEELLRIPIQRRGR